MTIPLQQVQIDTCYDSVVADSGSLEADYWWQIEACNFWRQLTLQATDQPHRRAYGRRLQTERTKLDAFERLAVACAASPYTPIQPKLQ